LIDESHNQTENKPEGSIYARIICQNAKTPAAGLTSTKRLHHPQRKSAGSFGFRIFPGSSCLLRTLGLAILICKTEVWHRFDAAAGKIKKIPRSLDRPIIQMYSLKLF